MKILVTGGSGFIGTNFIRYMLNKYDDIEIINIDALKYAATHETHSEYAKKGRYKFFKVNLLSNELKSFIPESIDYVVHFAAESHVDRSIQNPYRFIENNVLGTSRLIEALRDRNIKKFIHISTDEVYGSCSRKEGFNEKDILNPSNAYSSSKAASDLIALSYYKTFGFPVIVTRCSNNFGPYQYPEKFIPVVILNAAANKKIPLYGTGENIRDWIYVYDHASAIDAVLLKGTTGEIYNISGKNEYSNFYIANKILDFLGKNSSLIDHVKDRPGHDLRYSLDNSKIMSLGWKPSYSFENSLYETILWYIENKDYWKKRT